MDFFDTFVKVQKDHSLSRNPHYKCINTKQPNFVLSFADTSIKVTVSVVDPGFPRGGGANCPG